MRQYQEYISHTGKVSMNGIILSCKADLTDEWRRRPYHHPELHNGTALLHTDEGLNAYMTSYGEMHYIKLKAAFQNFPFEKIDGAIEIVDWGCGQGIGSLCCIDVLSQHDNLKWLKKVTLIEPSDAARERAKVNVERATNGAVCVLPIEAYLPSDNDDCLDGINYSAHNVIHIFSNILDIPTVNLLKLADIVSTSGHNHFIVCTGPLNAGAKRIDMFCNIFGNQTYFSDISDAKYAYTSDTYYSFTCKTKCFLYNGESLDRTKYVNLPNYSHEERFDDYDPSLAVQNGEITESMGIMTEIFQRILHPEDIVIASPDINGDKPNFVIIRPNKGILIVNLIEDDVKSYKGIKEEASGDSNNEMLSPLSVIDTYQSNLIKFHMEDMLAKALVNNHTWSLVKKMLVFTKNTNEEARNFFNDSILRKRYIFTYGREIFQDHEKQLKILQELNFVYDSSNFNERTMRSFLRVVSPRWHSYKQGKSINLTTIQKRLAMSVPGTMQKISGVAGAGKTQVLATRAVNAQVRTGRDVLVLTYNIALANYMRYRINEIRADFPWYKITISHFHQFFKAQANACGLKARLHSFDDEFFFEKNTKKIKKYAAIFIDEVQDYTTSWLQMLNRYFLEDGGEFVVFGDPKQNIFKRPLDSDGNVRIGFIRGLWNQQLKDPKRFSNPQLAYLANKFQEEFFSGQPTDGMTQPIQTDFNTKIKYWNIGRCQDANTITSNCRWIIEHFELNAADVTILSQTSDILCEIDSDYRQCNIGKTITTFVSKEDYVSLLKHHNIDDIQNAMTNFRFKRDKEALDHSRKIKFSMETCVLKISTIHSFKGWESPSIILVLEPAKVSDKERFCVSENENTKELIYTAITRSKENLFILNLGNDKYDKFFKQYE